MLLILLSAVPYVLLLIGVTLIVSGFVTRPTRRPTSRPTSRPARIKIDKYL